jgi:DNA-directed RNA polymerase specialized sigma24 family protein
VLQETFLAVWKNAGTYQPRGTPEAWLWVIARNQAALLLRKRGPAAQALLDEGPLAADPAEARRPRGPTWPPPRRPQRVGFRTLIRDLGRRPTSDTKSGDAWRERR